MIKQIPSSAKRAWQGKEKLWIVFWAWFVIPNVVEGIINNLSHFEGLPFVISFFRPTFFYLNIAIAIYILLLMPFSVFWSVTLWKCANNVNQKIWFYVTRTFVCLFVALFSFRVWELAARVFDHIGQ